MSVASTFTAVLATMLVGVNAAQAQDHPHPEPSSTQPSSEHRGHGMESGATQSELEHVPPDPPAHPMHDMPYEEMVKMMSMDDTAPYGMVRFDELDWRDANGADPLAWDMHAFYGTDYDKLWFKSEGERANGTTEEARAELLWDHIFSRWWSAQTGVRHDFGEGASRDWLAVGVEGMAPQFFDVEATAYFGEAGRTAARFNASYELFFTQRLILQPEVELNLYGKDDPDNRIASGLSDAQLALRLRYEFRREIAPYVGIAWVRHLGGTADLVRAAGEDADDLQALAGIRFWF